MNIKFLSPIVVAAGIMALLSASSVALASEGSTFGGPVGGTEIRSAYVPATSGWYLGLVSGFGIATREYGPNGVPAPGVSAQGYSIYPLGVGIMYVYPFKLYGGTLSSVAQIAYNFGRFKVNGTNDNFHGLADTYVQFLGWSKYIGSIGGKTEPSVAAPGLPYGLTIKLAYSMIFPTGRYTPNDKITIGHNVFFYIPNFAFTYLTAPNFLGDGLEFSSTVFFDIASYNHHTNYQTGLVGDIDFAVSERMGRWQAGLAGYYANQWQEDVQNGQPVQPDGRKLYNLAIGPIVAYDIPAWKASVKLKVYFPVGLHESLNTTKVFLSFSKAL